MMRKLLLPLLALLSFAVQAEVWQARYGVAETFNFKLFNADGTLDVDEADGGTEVSLSCNEGAETTATNDFVDEGTFYSIALTSGEMSCERIAVVIAATTTEVFFIQTSANASAMTPSYEANVGSVTDGTFVAADFASDAFTAAKFASDVGTEFANATWALDATGQQTQGSFGQAIGDPAADTDSIWSLANTNLNATVSSRASQTTLDTLDDFVDTEVAAIKTKTDFLPSATAGATGGLFIAGTNAATTITTGLTTTFTGNVTGSVGSVTGAVGSVTGAVGSVTAVSSGAINEASFATTAGSFDALGIIDQGTAQAATGTTLQLRSAATFVDDEVIGATCVITGGSAGVGQARTISDYVSSTDTATVETWTTTPTGTITYQCFGTAASTGGGGLDAAGIRAAVGLASANLDTQLSTIDNFIDTEVADILTDTSTTLDDLVDDLESRLGTPSNLGGGATVAFNLSDIEAQTDDIGAAGAGLTATDDAIMTRVGAPVGASISADVAAVKTDTAATLADTGTDGVVVATASKTGYALSAAGIDSIWDEVQSGHVTAGTFGAYLDAPVSSGAGGGLDAAGVRAAIGLATANLDTQLSTIDNFVDTEVADILVDTGTTLQAEVDGIQADTEDLQTQVGAAGAGLTAADDAVMTRLGAPAGASVSADIAAVEDQTDDIGAAGAGLTAVDDAVLAAIAALNNLSAAQLRDLVIEDQGSGVSLGCALSVILAYAAGDLATTGTTPTYEDPSGTETRATGTIASTGNRAMTITCPTY